MATVVSSPPSHKTYLFLVTLPLSHTPPLPQTQVSRLSPRDSLMGRPAIPAPTSHLVRELPS